jgi:hypothetical protein
VTASGRAESRGDRGDPPEAVLRAKYLDYCSARVADALLRLSADEMYVLAHEVARGDDREVEEPLSFGAMVKLATAGISRQLELPDFPTWANEYRANPEYYEQRLFGLWKTELKSSSSTAH